MSPENPIRLMVADIDGTLLDSSHRLMPITEQALHDAISRGVKFTVATGKTFPSTLDLIKQFNIQIPVICGNGTLVYTPDGQMLYQNPIEIDSAIEAIRLAERYGLTAVVYSGYQLAVRAQNDHVQILIDHSEPVPEIIPNLETALRGDFKPDKVLFINKDDLPAVAEFQTVLEKTFVGRATVLRSGIAALVELLPAGVTKATALAFILDYLKISAEQTMCFGDNCNDLDMIRLAGIGVAMGHAPEAVRRGADYVTTTNDEDGVGLAIQKFVLMPHAA